MNRYFGCLLLALFPILAEAMELSPWYPTEFEFQARADYVFQTYQSVAKKHGSFHHAANDNFLNLSLGVPYYDWYVDADLLLADTRHRNFGFDSLHIEGRYQLLDDVALADPISLIVSTVFSSASKTALHDISSFHHGQVEAAFFVSAGKEFDYQQFWTHRFWGTAGLGIADTGSPWITYGLHVDHNFCNRHRFDLSLEGLYGFGGKGLKSNKHFKGYGPIAHRSLDLGVCYTYKLPSEAELSFGYSYRVFARNFPENAQRYLLAFLYPFSL